MGSVLQLTPDELLSECQVYLAKNTDKLCSKERLAAHIGIGRAKIYRLIEYVEFFTAMHKVECMISEHNQVVREKKSVSKRYIIYRKQSVIK